MNNKGKVSYSRYNLPYFFIYNYLKKVHNNNRYFKVSELQFK